MGDLSTKLRIEISENDSGVVLNSKQIPELKEKFYWVKDIQLDGDAPKQFIHAYFYEEGSNVHRKNLNSWPAYIAKTAEKWYPHESVIEYMINRIGEEMGMEMNRIKLVKINTQIRFLSQYFLVKNEVLTHGAEICGEHLGDMDMAKAIAKSKSTARDLFTFEFIEQAILSVYPSSCTLIMSGLAKMIAFDAIVGNNDRHFYNWGIVDSKLAKKKSPKFAPIYDSARGLLWNLSDENVVKHLHNYRTGGKKIENYIKESHPRISIENNREANHFELVEFIKKRDNDYGNIIEQLASEENERKVIAMVRKEFFKFFIPERAQLIEIIIKNRFNKVRSI